MLLILWIVFEVFFTQSLVVFQVLQMWTLQLEGYDLMGKNFTEAMWITTTFYWKLEI